VDNKWFIELYEKQNKDCPVLSFLQSLPPKHRAKLEREIDLLEEFGFIKKSDETPISEIEKAKIFMIDYIQRRDEK